MPSTALSLCNQVVTGLSGIDKSRNGSVEKYNFETYPMY